MTPTPLHLHRKCLLFISWILIWKSEHSKWAHSGLETSPGKLRMVVPFFRYDFSCHFRERERRGEEEREGEEKREWGERGGMERGGGREVEKEREGERKSEIGKGKEREGEKGRERGKERERGGRREGKEKGRERDGEREGEGQRERGERKGKRGGRREGQYELFCFILVQETIDLSDTRGIAVYLRVNMSYFVLYWYRKLLTSVVQEVLLVTSGSI